VPVSLSPGVVADRIIAVLELTEPA
jgi:hypothetical protein